MGRQSNKNIKRRRRDAYNKRKKALVKTKIKKAAKS